MYNVVLAAVLLTGGEATSWHRGGGYGCSGCYGCYGGSSCYGSGCHGYHGCHGYRGCYGSYCSGCYGSYCSGCYGNWGYSFYSSCSGCWGCYGSYGCTGNFCSGGGVVVAMPSCYGCTGGYGCSGCYGSTMTAPPLAGGSGNPEIVPVNPKVTMPTADDKVAPQTEAERDAVRKLRQKMRDKKQGGGLLNPEETSVPAAPKVATTARLTVSLPADARLWVDQVECPLASSVRSFQTPVLQPGRTYFYTLKVEVRRNGVPVTDSQRVLVRAGAHVTVDFANVMATATAQR